MAKENEAAEDDRTNFDWNAAHPFIERIDKLEAEIADIEAEAKRKKSKLRDDIKVIKTEAHDAGFRRQPFNKALKLKKTYNELVSIGSDLTGTQREEFDKLREIIGLNYEQLDLFKAAGA